MRGSCRGLRGRPASAPPRLLRGAVRRREQGHRRGRYGGRALPGALHVLSGVITLGDLLLILGYVALLYDPINTIASRIERMQSSLTSAERAYTLLDERRTPESPYAIGWSGRAVKFDHVSYRYADGPLALDDVSFEHPAGQPGRRPRCHRGREDDDPEPVDAVRRPDAWPDRA